VEHPGVVLIEVRTTADVATIPSVWPDDAVAVVQAEDASEGAVAAEACAGHCRAVFVGPDRSEALVEFLGEMGWA
jgi:hypothetical protein